MIKTSDGENLYYASIHNFSNDGMYCCSSRALKPNTVITVRFDDQPFKYAPKMYLCEIKRCEELESNSKSPLYGLGMKIIKILDDNKLSICKCSKGA
jgi:hypothetical protein